MREGELGKPDLGGLREAAVMLNLLASTSACMITVPRLPVAPTTTTFLIGAAI